MALPRAAELGLKIYGVDAEILASRGEVWAFIAPRMPEIIRSYVADSLEHAPFYRETLSQNVDQVEQLILQYTEKLFTKPFDEQWIADAKDRVYAEIALSFDMRNRSVISRYILSDLDHALQAGWRVNKARACKLIDVATRILMLDAANAVILHYDIQVRAARGHREQLETAIREFQASVQDVRQTLENGIVALTENSTQLTKSASDASTQRDTAARAADNTFSHVSSIAAATEELNTSIAEIRQQAENGTGMAHDAVACADRAGTTIQSLSDIVGQIGSIVELISNIASQTNLLALNATIEAARAGEAGRGFSVVASEVKSLASQTSKATQDIGQQIAVVEETTRRSVEEIVNTCKRISSIAEIAEVVSSAVGEQVAATGSIAVSAADASANAGRVTAALDTVGGTIRQTQTAATSIRDFSAELSTRTAQINGAIDTLFKVAADAVGTKKLVNLVSASRS